MCSAHRQVLRFLIYIVLDLRRASWPLRKGCLLSFYPAFLLADKITMLSASQTLCLLLMTHMTALSSPTRLNTSSLRLCQTKKYLRPFSKATDISQLCGFNVPDSTPYRRVLQMTVFIILFFRQRLIMTTLFSSSFLLVNAFFARAILGDNDIACNF